MVRGRFLDSGALTGAANMALDAALLDSVAAGALPVLRLYAWSAPTLSLGYFQNLKDVANESFLGSRGIEVVRRPTGGGAILHAEELTFSLSLPLSLQFLDCSVNDSYLRLCRPLLEILRKLGIEAKFRGQSRELKAVNCFAGQACPDLVVADKKVFGSAQRRKQGAVLMHGSLLFRVDEGLWQGVFGERLGSGFAGVGHAWEDWGSFLRQAYGELLDIQFEAGKGGSGPTGQGAALVLS